MTRVTPEELALLTEIPYLAALSEVELRDLARHCTVRRLRKTERLFEEGDAAQGLFVIVEGRIALVRRSARGREQILHTEGRGATLAEVPVFDGGGYLASAVALAPTRALMIPRDRMLAACRRRPAVAAGVIAVLAQRLRRFAGTIEDLALHDVTARVARFLAEESARAGGGEVTLAGTREEIAARLGTVRELVSRALSRLGAEGAIHVRGRRVRVVDRGRLLERNTETGASAPLRPPSPRRRPAARLP